MVHLGIDPFVFRDRHAGVPGVPEAIYRWRITRIREHTAPEPPRDVWRSFEETPWTVRDVSKTAAWNTRPGFETTYLMDCERLNQAPVRGVET
ncbi:hypothetical protein [Longimicrobium terrae]|uniref:Uncharacterized protein n=1 Tax=Longimicrobium terrae TaxID=1639882 RepID=A0A841H1B6_9BACT|nr:hypothetical protein [Longimicrobium terrae]MBB4637395.1 hypothetical protein [Longimicrobium terrae]MBB6071793.1 hypothetical protein [Longimicrobium terrae]NNC28553.1 hypothetical protein [Longimicrobium terrae]